MNNNHQLNTLPNNFNQEKKALISLGINSWLLLKNMKDIEINKICQSTLATERNLKRLRCIAMLKCKLKITPKEAALLMHSGISSIKALAELSPQELITKTGRLERLLNIRTTTGLKLNKANELIQKAKNLKNENLN